MTTDINSERKDLQKRKIQHTRLTSQEQMVEVENKTLKKSKSRKQKKKSQK